MYIRGSTGKKQIQASSNLWAIAIKERYPHLSAVMRLSLAFMLSLNAWKWRWKVCWKRPGLFFFLLHPCPISSCCKERIPNGFALPFQTRANFLATNKTSQISNVKVVCVGILKIDKVLRSSVTSEATEDRIDRVGKILKKLCFGFVAAFREEASLGF